MFRNIYMERSARSAPPKELRLWRLFDAKTLTCPTRCPGIHLLSEKRQNSTLIIFFQQENVNASLSLVAAYTRHRQQDAA